MSPVFLLNCTIEIYNNKQCLSCVDLQNGFYQGLLHWYVKVLQENVTQRRKSLLSTSR